MAVKIIYEVHATSVDNENRICSGFYDVELSISGTKQASELGERHVNEQFAAIFCSDLRRSYRTAEIAFHNRFVIIQDTRLRECNYGDFTRHSASEVEPQKLKRIAHPFPNGESYEQTTRRIGKFLSDLQKSYDSKKVLIIGHGATRGGLEYWLNGKTIEESIIASKEWAPGWEYNLHKIDLSRLQ
jgi:broad specificity phosphatase PhoE